MNPAQELRETIQRTVKGMGLATPLVRESVQPVVDSPTPLPRVGAGTWLIDYRAATLLTPDADTPAWTAHLTGDPCEVLAGILRLTTTGTDAAWYHAESSGIATNAVGNVAQILLRPVETAACGLNQGENLTLCDGRFQWTVWLRQGGLNIDGQAEVAVTLDDAPHWITLVAKGAQCTVSVDGRELATGPPAGPSAAQAVTFGNAVDQSLIGA